jgi:hypothetical protein
VASKLVVTESDKGRIVSLQSSRGSTLLMSAPLADKRAVAGAIRSIRAVLKDRVVVDDDRTVSQRPKPPRRARVARAPMAAKAAIASVPASPERQTRAAKALSAPPASIAAGALESVPKTRKRATRTAKK